VTKSRPSEQFGFCALLLHVLANRDYTLNAALLLLILIIPGVAVVLAALSVLTPLTAATAGGLGSVGIGVLGWWTHGRSQVNRR
jgi:hypothetical protein